MRHTLNASATALLFVLGLGAVLWLMLPTTEFLRHQSIELDGGFVRTTYVTEHGPVHADWYDRVSYVRPDGAREFVCMSTSDAFQGGPSKYDDGDTVYQVIPLEKWFPVECDLSRPGRYLVLSGWNARPFYGSVLGWVSLQGNALAWEFVVEG